MPVLDFANQFAARLRSALAQVRPREFALASGRCPFCGPSAFLRLRNHEIGVRCVRCLATAVHASLGLVLREHVPNLSACSVCELSARGPLATYLVRRARSIALSEYIAGTESGAVHDDVRCEDVQHLTYNDASFDVITHTEVLEHVPDDRRAFVELRRVLKPGGIMLFTVPLHGGTRTVERARQLDDGIEYLKPPAYHRDPLRGGAGILAFRDYGNDIVDRLLAAGFTRSWIQSPAHRQPWGIGRDVVVARRDEKNQAPQSAHVVTAV